MIIKREYLSNFAFIILLGLLLFTPVGFHVRVFVSRMISFSPSVLDEEEQLVLTDYSWKLTSSDGQALDFKDLTGKTILVNYWATWCPPCVAEMPSLYELYEDYNDKVAFVFVAHDEAEKVKQYLNKKKYSLPVYFEISASPEKLATKSIPTTFIIDSSGKIVVEKTGSANWNSDATRALLDNLIKK